MARIVSSAIGVPLDAETYWVSKREGLANRGALAAAGVPATAIPDICDAWIHQIENDEWLALDFPLDGAVEALHLVRRHGIRAAVVTARQRPAGVSETLARLGLTAMIDEIRVVAPGSRVSEHKASCLRSLTAELFIGDTESDRDAAEYADAEFIGVECGQRSATSLRKHGLSTICSSLLHAVSVALQEKL